MTLKSAYELFGADCGDGWKPLYQPVIELCKALDIEIRQVKEKFGLLRIYIGGVNATYADAIYGAIDDAERRSAHICEDCGYEDEVVFKIDTPITPCHCNTYAGKVTTEGTNGSFWICTLCGDCRIKAALRLQKELHHAEEDKAST